MIGLSVPPPPCLLPRGPRRPPPPLFAARVRLRSRPPAAVVPSTVFRRRVHERERAAREGPQAAASSTASITRPPPLALSREPSRGSLATLEGRRPSCSGRRHAFSSRPGSIWRAREGLAVEPSAPFSAPFTRPPPPASPPEPPRDYSHAFAERRLSGSVPCRSFSGIRQGPAYHRAIFTCFGGDREASSPATRESLVFGTVCLSTVCPLRELCHPGVLGCWHGLSVDRLSAARALPPGSPRLLARSVR